MQLELFGTSWKYFISFLFDILFVPGFVKRYYVLLPGSVSNPPTEGVNNVVITYTDGDKCKDRKYQTKITFLCEKGEGVSLFKFCAIDILKCYSCKKKKGIKKVSC